MSESEVPAGQPERRMSYTEKYGAEYGQPQGVPVNTVPGAYGAPVHPGRVTWSGSPHPKATTALVLGILGVTLCGFAAPFAWVVGGRAVRDIDYSRGRLSGRGTAQAGRILGIVGTLLMVVSFILVIALIGYAANHPATTQP